MSVIFILFLQISSGAEAQRSATVFHDHSECQAVVEAIKRRWRVGIYEAECVRLEIGTDE